MSTRSNISRDLVHAARSLAKARAFTFVCVATLGIEVPVARSAHRRIARNSCPLTNAPVGLMTRQYRPNSCSAVDESARAGVYWRKSTRFVMSLLRMRRHLRNDTHT